MATYGLLGRNISYSFSKNFFEDFFKKSNLNHQYLNFDIQSLAELHQILDNNQNLKGLNVTIPFKQEIIPHLTKINKTAREIGAVNTIKINSKGSLTGYNTDHYGFAMALSEFLPLKNKKALILGTGGASKAVEYVLKNLDFEISCVSRKKIKNGFSYKELNEEIILKHFLIVNCTPLGTCPNFNNCPNIPYQAITNNHLLFDLIYNPKLTLFLKYGKDRGAKISNGLKMLEFQAKKSWEIWNK